MFFCSEKIAHTKAIVNGKKMSVILDSAASVPIINQKLVAPGKEFRGRDVQVYDWKNEATSVDQWTNIKLEIGPCKKQVACLIVSECPYLTHITTVDARNEVEPSLR